MDKREVMRKAADRVRWIEENYPDYDHNEGLLSYALLLKLIAVGSFSKYFSEMGGAWQTISVADALDGKEDLGLGQLTTFEKDCLHALNGEIARRENIDIIFRQRRATSVHQIGSRQT